MRSNFTNKIQKENQQEEALASISWKGTERYGCNQRHTETTAARMEKQQRSHIAVETLHYGTPRLDNHLVVSLLK